jgi:hypothetical protein
MNDVDLVHAMLHAGMEVDAVLEFVEQMCRLNNLPLHKESLSAILVRTQHDGDK